MNKVKLWKDYSFFISTRFSLTQIGIGIFPYRSGLINNLVKPPKIFKRWSFSILIWPLTVVFHVEKGEDPWHEVAGFGDVGS